MAAKIQDVIDWLRGTVTTDGNGWVAIANDSMTLITENGATYEIGAQCTYCGSSKHAFASCKDYLDERDHDNEVEAMARGRGLGGPRNG